MKRVREEHTNVAVGARVVVLWHGREREGVVIHRIRGSGRLQVRLLDNNAAPQVAPDHYVCTLTPDRPDRPGTGMAEQSAEAFLMKEG